MTSRIDTLFGTEVMPYRNRDTTVAIIGGGFTGAAVAWNLANAGLAAPTSIVVFEPREKLGAGLAYDTRNPVHRINVPATRMSLDTSRPEQFMAWLTAQDYLSTDPDALAADGNLYPRRQAFGQYVYAQVEPYLRNGRIAHRRAEVERVTRTVDGRWRITASDGQTLDADCVVIATSHPAPVAPRSLSNLLEGHPRYVPDANAPHALASIRKTDSVLVVGNGLTSADVVASLLAEGHQGSILAISRRGLRSRGHAAVVQELYGDFLTRPVTTARNLTKRIREAISQARAQGLSWHAVLDAVRGQARDIWSNLSIDERRRLVRHLRPFWDVHRFRIAPQLEKALDDARSRGQFTSLAASIQAVAYHDSRIRVALKAARRGGPLLRDVDAVIVTTGPAHGGVVGSQPFLAGMAEAGLIAADPIRLGLSCDHEARILAADGQVIRGLFVAGPLARGTFGELMGLPQVSDHARLVAEAVAAFMAEIRASDDAA